MEISSWIVGILFGTALLAAIETPPRSDLYDVDTRALATLWENEHVSPSDPATLKHADLNNRLRAFAKDFPAVARLEEAGRSTEGRQILLLGLGRGPRNILLWSQMHGDETTATSSLLDLAQFVATHQEEPWVSEVLRKFTLLCVPMLNPDGAERRQRRNAQGIDINRDARKLQTPEGRILKSLRDRYNPFLGFNLHNQNSLTTVGDTGEVATIALLAVASGRAGKAAANAQGDEIPSENLAKQVTAVLFEALAPFVYGHISRYDEDFNPRAFGDNLTLWGTPIVLIESGGNPAGQPAGFGVMLNFVGLLATLDSLAGGRIQNANPAVFDALKMNSDTPIHDLLLRDAWICNGAGIPLFKGDIAIRRELRGDAGGHSVIADLGDLGVFKAHQTVDCSGMMVTPGLIAWDPEKPLAGGGPPDKSYLERGILTVLESADLRQIAGRTPDPELWRAAARQVNWSFVVAGGTPASAAEKKLALVEWLAAGARGWIVDSDKDAAGIPQWFGVRALDKEGAERFRIPSALQGDPASVLPHWTSEAAKQFGLLRRGTIAVGAIPDLVIWTVAPGTDPVDLGACKPSRAVIDGRLIELSNPEVAGKFLGRQQ